MKAGSLACAAAVAACVASGASAGTSTAHYLPCGSTEGMGSFSGLVTYSWVSGGTASVSIVLSNTTPAAMGGFITGLAINGGSGVTGLSFVSCDMSTFAGLVGPVSTPPYGSFMAGASTGNSWLGGGDPSKGIGDGNSATFVFSVTGAAADLSALTAEDVFGEDPQMAVRFRGGSPDDWSDKVLGCALPAPGAFALLGVMGMLAPARRR
jgi:hypothetical protein